MQVLFWFVELLTDAGTTVGWSSQWVCMKSISVWFHEFLWFLDKSKKILSILMRYKNQSKRDVRLWHGQCIFGSKIYACIFNKNKTKSKKFLYCLLRSDMKQFDTIPGCRKSKSLINKVCKTLAIRSRNTWNDLM